MSPALSTTHSQSHVTNPSALVHPESQMTTQNAPSFTSDAPGSASSATSAEFGVRSDDPGHHSVPYRGQTRMLLTILSGTANARVRIDPDATELISIIADGVETRLRVSPTELRLSWPKALGTWLRAAFVGAHPDIEIVLHPAVEWSLAVRGGLSRFSADLAAGKLTGIDVQGGVSHAHFELPTPTSPVAVRVAGGVSELSLRRPAETGVSLAIRGGVSTLHLDEQQFGSIGGGSRLVSGAVHGATPRYAVEISGGASGVCVTGY